VPVTAITRNPELRRRVISGLVLALLAIGLTIEGAELFIGLWTLAGLLVAFEWQRLVSRDGWFFRFLASSIGVLCVPLAWFVDTVSLAAVGLGVSLLAVWALAGNRRGWAVAGVVYAFALTASVVALRLSGPKGLDVVLWLFAIVWSTDVAAYFVGRRLGGPKLWPSISPKKTWSGFVGGALGAVLAASLYLLLRGQAVGPAQAAVALALSVGSQAGDLLESAIKRRFGAKDAGTLIPGHGGVMDRVDGFVVAAVLAVLLGLWRAGPGALGEGVLLW
jgi:phosphatidate cytidylyltransferase